MKSLNDDEAFAIVEMVLDRHGLDASSHSFGGVADGLGIASDEMDFWTASAINRKEIHDQRLVKIQRLADLVELYSCEVAGGDEYRASIEGRSISATDSAVFKSTRLDLLSHLDHLKALLAAEKELYAAEPKGGLPNSRPPKAKNVGAECIYEVLRENDMKPWAACSLIAELLIEAGIETRPHRNVLRSLFDKLKRTEVR